MHLRSVATAILFLLPAGILLLVFRLAPMVQAFWLSLTSWDLFSDPRFIGLANYQRLFADPHFFQTFGNNLVILLAVPVWVLGPLLIASVLHERGFGWRFFRLAFFVPVALSPVIVGIYYGIMLGGAGPINSTLQALNLGFLARPWLADPQVALFAVIFVLIWHSFGVGVIIYLAALGHVDLDLVDAAVVDGARWRDLQYHVVIPALRPVIGFWSILIIIQSFTSLFPIIYSLTSGGPGYATYVLDFFVYREAFGNNRLGYASAIGVVLLLIVGSLAILQWRLFRDRGTA